MRFAVVGDVHGALDGEDVRLLDAAGYDAVLFVGDLATRRAGTELAVARVIAGLRTPTFVLPGNHDAVTLAQLGAELFGARGLGDRLGAGMERRVAALREALGPARLVGWERVDLGGVQLVAARPHSFGGPSLAFAGYLERAFGVGTLDGAAERLGLLLADCDARPIVVLAHNGPAGLGERREAPFGRDFHSDEGDWGDPDLAAALRHARDIGLRVVAVAAGHMHHSLRGGGRRRTVMRLDEALVVNAARVPRVDREGWRHHVRLLVESGTATAAAVSWRRDEERVVPLTA